MTTIPAPTRRVFVRVAPRLLGDALSMVLRGQEIDVVLDPEQGLAIIELPERFDVALVTGPLPSDVDAGIVVLLDDAGSRARILPAGQDVELPPGDELGALVDILRDVLR
jgi:hypothetical protein